MRLLFALAIVLSSGAARADVLRARVGFEGELGYLATTPDFYVAHADDAPRPLIGGRVAGSTASLPIALAGFDIAVVDRDRWVFPLLGARVGGAYGPVADEVTTIDGSIARLRRASTMLVDLQFAGFGLRAKHRRWSYGFEIVGGTTLAIVQGSYAYGARESDFTAMRVNPMLRGSIEICRRIDPASRACLAAAAHLYELGWWNGGALALRWELGA